MNWGYKLMFVFIAFAIFMGTLVYKCMRSPALLVSTNYYKDELKYQQVIDGSEKANTLSSAIKVNIQNDTVVLQLPAEMKRHSTKGEIWFYCVANGHNDRKARLCTNEDGRQQFALSMFNTGRYIAKVDWEADGTKYYSEKEIIIP
jgi:nitrogen fixation protein FixH